ncbi:hypothetical protein ACVWYQ_003113 [Bradyrhizobium sp. USDA 3397]
MACPAKSLVQRLEPYRSSSRCPVHSSILCARAVCGRLSWWSTTHPLHRHLLSRSAEVAPLRPKPRLSRSSSGLAPPPRCLRPYNVTPRAIQAPSADLLASTGSKAFERGCREREAFLSRAPPKVYSLHEPEVGSVRRSRAQRLYEFGVKFWVAIGARQDGQFVANVKAKPCNSFDGDTCNRHPPDGGADQIPSSARSATKAIAATYRPIKSSAC